MKFGMMYEIQIPEPHYPGIERERYHQVMAQVELGDQVGFDYFWTVEHHFLSEFSHRKCYTVPFLSEPNGYELDTPLLSYPANTTIRCVLLKEQRSWT